MCLIKRSCSVVAPVNVRGRVGMVFADDTVLKGRLVASIPNLGARVLDGHMARHWERGVIDSGRHADGLHRKKIVRVPDRTIIAGRLVTGNDRHTGKKNKNVYVFSEKKKRIGTGWAGTYY